MTTLERKMSDAKDVKVLLTLPEAHVVSRLLEVATRLEEFASMQDEDARDAMIEGMCLEDFTDDIVAIMRGERVQKFMHRLDYRIKCATLEARRILDDNADAATSPRKVDLA